MSSKLREAQNRMRDWIAYLSNLDEADIDQMRGNIDVAVTSDNTVHQECGMCIAAHYDFFSSKGTEVENPLHKREVQRGDWYLHVITAMPDVKIYHTSFLIGMKKMVDDMSEFYATEEGLQKFADRLAECIVDSTDDEFPTYGAWSEDSLEGEYIGDFFSSGIGIPRAFSVDDWPCSPVKAFKLYAQRYLGMVG